MVAGAAGGVGGGVAVHHQYRGKPLDGRERLAQIVRGNRHKFGADVVQAVEFLVGLEGLLPRLLWSKKEKGSSKNSFQKIFVKRSQ